MEPVWRRAQVEGKSRHPLADAFRIWPAGRSGLPAVDLYGDWGVVWMRDDAVQDLPQQIASELDLEGLVVKRAEGRGHSNRIESVIGRVPEVVEVREGRCRFGCRLTDPGPTGLYLDLEPTRLAFADRFDGGQVLNLFAYTGAFSAHAAAGGAERVTTVDASRKALRWARENFERSGLDPDRHRWFDDDALAHLRRAQTGSADWIVCDPPAFGRAGARQFKLRRDLPPLVDELVRVARRSLLLTTHDPGIAPGTLQVALHRAADRAGRPLAELEPVTLPDDFQGPEAHTLIGVWATFA